MGGVFNPVNLNVYHYAGLNPVKFVDPDGEAIFPVAIGLAILYVLSDLAPLNNNEHKLLESNKDNYSAKNAAAYLRDSTLSIGLQYSADFAAGKIKVNKEINKATSHTVKAQRYLENAGQSTMNTRRFLNKNLANNIKKIKSSPLPTSILGKVLSKATNVISIGISYYGSYKECEKQGKEWKEFKSSKK